MKHSFDINKINIFSMLLGNFEQNPIITKCIESWKEIPNTDIHIFTDEDINDTFPDLLNNDKNYIITKNANTNIKIKHCYLNENNEMVYENRKTEPLFIKPGICNFSTDTLRYRLMKKNT